MKRFVRAVYETAEGYVRVVSTMLKREDGFGRDEILGTAAVLIIAAFITIPQLRLFVNALISALNSWWGNTIHDRIFPTA